MQKWHLVTQNGRGLWMNKLCLHIVSAKQLSVNIYIYTCIYTLYGLKQWLNTNDDNNNNNNNINKNEGDSEILIFFV